jgi:translation elongation factor EF-Tu-like GTPase
MEVADRRALTTEPTKNSDGDFIAKIRFLTTEEGGRLGPVKSGYRPDHNFGLRGEINGAQHDYGNEDIWVALGETVSARLSLVAPRYQRGRLYSGMGFTIQEGSKLVGRGSVVEILNPDLTQPPQFWRRTWLSLKSRLPRQVRNKFDDWRDPTQRT